MKRWSYHSRTESFLSSGFHTVCCLPNSCWIVIPIIRQQEMRPDGNSSQVGLPQKPACLVCVSCQLMPWIISGLCHQEGPHHVARCQIFWSVNFRSWSWANKILSSYNLLILWFYVISNRKQTKTFKLLANLIFSIYNRTQRSPKMPNTAGCWLCWQKVKGKGNKVKQEL